MPTTLRYIGAEERFFETAVTGSQQMWLRGQIGPASDAHAVLLLATGKFERYERNPVFEQNDQIVTAPGEVVGGGGGLPYGIVTVSDSTGSDGFNPAQTVQQQVFDCVGWWAAAYSSGAVRVASTCSVGGWTTTDVDQYWQARVAGLRIGFVVLGIGLNDIYGATDATVASVEASLREWYSDKIAQIRAWGGIPIIQTTFPCGSGYFASTTTKRLAAFNHNKWRRKLAAELGVPLLDAEALMIDPASASAEPYAAYMQPAGSPHAGKELIRTLGQMLWDQTLSKLVPMVGLEQCNRYASNQLFSNPGFAGNGGNINGGNGASVLPDSVWGWQTGTHTT